MEVPWLYVDGSTLFVRSFREPPGKFTDLSIQLTMVAFKPRYGMHACMSYSQLSLRSMISFKEREYKFQNMIDGARLVDVGMGNALNEWRFFLSI